MFTQREGVGNVFLVPGDEIFTFLAMMTDEHQKKKFFFLPAKKIKE